ncbi:hypothetical protein Tco_1287852, partial [Tanacetum coccineum]
MKRGFLCSRGTWRSVKEKEGTTNDGSSWDNNCMNDVNVNVTSSTDVDLVMAGHDNLHDENAGQTPNNSTTNLNKGTSFDLFSGESSRKSVNFRTLIIQAGNRIDVVVLLESIESLFACVTDMWKLVFRWCDIPLFQASSWDSFNDWIISWHASKEKKHRLYVITTSVLWWLWRYRNSVTFNSQ